MNTDHYFIPTDGQLVIINVTSDDNAIYTFGCTNFIGDIHTNIELVIARSNVHH